MTDVTQGADAPDDNALFNDATSTDTLEKFENPPEPPPVAPPDKKVEPPAPVEPPVKEEAAVPSGRFREETEARRRAERERDELRGRLDAMRPPPQQQPPPAVDLFENPDGFVEQKMKPFVEQMRADFQMQREAMSLDFAMRNHGREQVDTAYQAMREGMSRGDQNAWGTYNRAMQSHDPYSVIVGWHKDGEALRSIGGDINAYRTRILDEALKDPEYQKRVMEATREHAVATGTNVARPVRPSVASSPSLGNFGAGGGNAQVVEPTDDELFRAATTAKRR